MNIFKILSSGDGSIKEPNISAFLGYLLDPNKEHGLKDFLLKSVISPLIINNDKLSELQINDNIVNLTNESKFRVNVELEKKVKNTKNKDRYIDIVISIYNISNLEQPLFVICIENKIRTTSITKNQLKEQVDGISKKYADIPIGFIYLTPTKTTASIQEYEDFKKEYSIIPSYHLFWNDANDDSVNDSIYQLLVDMLEKEAKGRMEPIFEYSKYTIKAFINFIDSDFQSYLEEKSNINKKLKYKQPIRWYIRQVFNELAENKTYKISEIKKKVSDLVYKDNNLAINKGTLNAQVYMSIVNEKNRIHYNVNEKNHDKFDLFYYIDDSKSLIKKYPKETGVDGIKILYQQKN